METRHVPAFLRRLRAERNLTQRQASRLLGVAQGTFSRWEKGVHAPNRQQMSRIAELLGMEPAAAPWRAPPMIEAAAGRKLMVDGGGRLVCVSAKLATLVGRAVSDLCNAPVATLLDDDGRQFLRTVAEAGFFRGEVGAARAPVTLRGAAGPCRVLLTLSPVGTPGTGITGYGDVQVLPAAGDAGEKETAAEPAAGICIVPTGELHRLRPPPPAALHENVIFAPPPVLVRSPVLTEFYAYWRHLGGGTGPAPERLFKPGMLPPASRRRLYLFRVAQGRIRVAFMGAQIVAEGGVDHSGRHLDEIPGTAAVQARMAHLVKTGLPYLALASHRCAYDPSAYQTLVCPLHDDALETVTAIVSVSVTCEAEATGTVRQGGAAAGPPAPAPQPVAAVGSAAGAE